MTRAPHLRAGFAQYMYLPWNSVLHKVPDGLSPEMAGLVAPMANGIQWALFDCMVGYQTRQQETAEFPNFPLAKLCNKYVTVKLMFP